MAEEETHTGPAWQAWLQRLAWGGAIVAMALLVLHDRLPLVLLNHDVGHADEAAYALQARGLALAGSSKVPYVSVFFRRYDPVIWRHDDHWPPMLGWVLAPFFRWGGVDAARGRAVCVGLGAVLLPLSTALLALAATRRRWLAGVAAALMLADTLVFGESLRILSDVLMTACVAGFAAAVLAGRRHSRWYWAAGACAACATLAKGSQVMLLGMLPLGALLVGGHREWRKPRVWGGVAVGLALLLPWWTTMYLEYGNPFHSTQNSVSAFYGIGGGWDESFYRIHWDARPPSLADRFDDMDRWEQATRRNGETFLRSVLLGEEARRKDWDSLGRFGDWVREVLLEDRRKMQYIGRPPPPLPRPWRTVLHGIALAWGTAMLLLRPFVRLFDPAYRRQRKPTSRKRAVPRDRPVWELGAGAFLAVLLVAEAGFVILLWSAEQPRFAMGLLPLLTVLGLGAAAAVVRPAEWAAGKLSDAVREGLRRTVVESRWHGWPEGTLPAVGSALLAVAFCAGAVRLHRPLLEWQLARTGVTGFEEDYYPTYHAVAHALAKAGIGEDAVVMTRNPWELLFYAPVGMRAVGLPYAVPEDLFQVARHYGVTHIILDANRPGLRGFLADHWGRFRQVAASPYPVYALPNADGQ